jgi:hypothetical protein
MAAAFVNCDAMNTTDAAPFRLLTYDEFSKLSTDDKIMYLAQELPAVAVKLWNDPAGRVGE